MSTNPLPAEVLRAWREKIDALASTLESQRGIHAEPMMFLAACDAIPGGDWGLFDLLPPECRLIAETAWRDFSNAPDVERREPAPLPSDG